MSKWGLCPTFPEHGRLYDGDAEYICPHAGHRDSQYDEQPAMRKSTWTLDELRALGVMP